MPYSDPDKQRAYQRDRKARLRRVWLEEHGPCASCGSTDRLQVDHLDPTRKVDHRVWTWSEARRTEELAKCQVLCFDCHWSKTNAQRTPRWRHGLTGYRYKCKCSICKEANRASNARRKK